jgi:hypothetical protein
MKPYTEWTSTDIAQHIERLRRLDGALGDDDRARRADPQAIDYLARKRTDAVDHGLARAHRWLTAALVFTAIAGATLAVAAYGDPVGRLAHDTARPAYCGAC